MLATNILCCITVYVQICRYWSMHLLQYHIPVECLNLDFSSGALNDDYYTDMTSYFMLFGVEDVCHVLLPGSR